MARHNYALSGYQEEHMARAVIRDAGISTKHAIEICNWIRKRPLAEAQSMLRDVLEQKRAVPFKRFTEGAGHKRGRMAGGQYPMKASQHFLRLLQSVENNAQQKDLDVEKLVIDHIAAQKASRPIRFSRHRGRETKRSHVEIVVKEGEIKKSSKKTEKPKAEAKKPEPKKAEGAEKKTEAPKKEPQPKKEAPKPAEKKEQAGQKPQNKAEKDTSKAKTQKETPKSEKQ